MSGPGSFGGELGLIGLFDLGQLLTLNRATGCLAVNDGDRRGYLYFHDGRLVNAVDDANSQGEAAAYRIFAWKSGTFEFRPEPPDGTVSIEVGTDALMLEAARRLDEATAGSGGQVATPTAERLIENQHALEALRDEFRRLTGEARALDGTTEGGAAAYVEALRRPGDCLIYRPGQVPRLRQGGVWGDAEGPPLGQNSYEALRTRLIHAAGAKLTPEPGVHDTHRIRLHDGRVVSLEIASEGRDEAMWLRPIDLSPPDPSRLDGEIELLDEILDLPAGILVIGGPHLDAMRTLLHTVVATIAARHGDAILLVSDDQTYRHAEAPGLVLRSRPANLRPALRAMSPCVVTLDAGIPCGHWTLEEISVAPRLIVGAVSSEAGSLATRALARLADGDRSRAEAHFSVAPISLVMTPGFTEEQSTIPFSAWRLSDQERRLALRGESAALLALLAQAHSREPVLKLHQA